MFHLISSNSFEYDADERQPWERTVSTGCSSDSISGLTTIDASTSEKAAKTDVSAITRALHPALAWTRPMNFKHKL
jgi:hypothetical protein